MSFSVLRGASLATLALFLAACGDDSVFAEIPCESSDAITVHCALDNPEDIAVLPGEQVLIIAQMGEFQVPQSTGSLVAYSVANDKAQPIEIDTSQPPQWGDAACTAPSFPIHPHGLDLSYRADGAQVLAVVNHEPREAVELFEVMGDDNMHIRLQWRGCLLPPAGSYLNSVVRLPDGRYFATHMFDRSQPQWWLLMQIALGLDLGTLMEWHPERGWTDRGNDNFTMPNGIAANNDGSTVYVNNYFGKEVVAYDPETHAFGKRYALASDPDNIKFAQGRLWVAGHDNSLSESARCDGRVTTCPLPFTIYSIDPSDDEAYVVLQHNGEAFGNATVAVPAAGRLWMGSFRGDRMGSVPLE